MESNEAQQIRPGLAQRMAKTETPLTWEQFKEATGTTDEALLRWTAELRPMHKLYTTGVSHAGMAASRQACGLMCALLEAGSGELPQRALDLGTGFSTACLRIFGDVEATSADDDKQWLEKTRSFLLSNAYTGYGLVTWEELVATRDAQGMKGETPPVYDVVFNDLGNIPTRGRHLERVLTMGHLVILDDLHLYERVVREVLSKMEGWKLYDLTLATLDDFGRYAWAVIWPDGPPAYTPSATST